MKRIMGIDYGDARTGIAVSDLLCSIVGTTKVIHSRNMDKTVAAVCELVSGSEIGEIVVGLPKNMDGSEGFRAEECRATADKIGEVSGLEVVLWDERCTTVSAHTVLNMNDTRGKKRKQTVDAVAAVMILEDYLTFRRNKKG